MRITRTTFKSFIKKHKDNLLIAKLSDFDGMVDCVMPSTDKDFRKAEHTKTVTDMNLGINGVYLCGGGGSGRDYYTEYNDGKRQGIEVSNCCGNFIVAVEV